jgi:hypothetical protein
MIDRESEQEVNNKVTVAREDELRVNNGEPETADRL